jgi:hypothetical protein
VFGVVDCHGFGVLKYCYFDNILVICCSSIILYKVTLCIQAVKLSGAIGSVEDLLLSSAAREHAAINRSYTWLTHIFDCLSSSQVEVLESHAHILMCYVLCCWLRCCTAMFSLPPTKTTRYSET